MLLKTDHVTNSSATSTVQSPTYHQTGVKSSTVGNGASVGGRFPGSIALPGLQEINLKQVNSQSNSTMNYGAKVLYSPEPRDSYVIKSPSPPPNGAATATRNSRPDRPGSLGGSSSGKSAGKRTRWLLCYPVAGGTASSDSPSPPSEAPSNASTPSPTDHGFKIPNSYSNERPTSLPVALLNSTHRGIGKRRRTVVFSSLFGLHSFATKTNDSSKVNISKQR